ncbi:hypothetical protein DICPUDRAFT_99158 [Dictyostelium purpureum]|uniref:EGF-like domain-containing protein n=1 Tax=Dictyostelium purpureum TaxID=5786 RepID=F0ZWR1_DICPU|nr:uncharacterized protein DICPUDRAFT_99158 [Dictyostelium purpureum]EGC31628.1 hypothetical protein DICPUDRAFT_99158 [Dictyostelium purpureum]|eukprot:XP_003291856.1 hypothetical protein DICPUDRAFT_99158 [Dictyostelium purpureum]
MVLFASESKRYGKTSSSNYCEFNIPISAQSQTPDDVIDAQPLSGDLIEYDVSNIKYSLLGSGIFYNTIGVLLQIDQIEVDLDLNLTAPYTQIYMGYNTYFIAFKYNNELLFDSTRNSISFSILFSSAKSLTINVPIVLQSSNNLPIYSLYPSDPSDLITDAGYAELGNIKDQYNNYFYTLVDGVQKNEPFLVGSKSGIFNYLVPLSGDVLQQSTYSLVYYYSNEKKVLFSQTLNQKNVADSIIMSATGIEDTPFFTVVLALSQVNLPYSLSFGQPEKVYRFPYGYNVNNIFSTLTFTYYFTRDRIVNDNVQFKANGLSYNYILPIKFSGIITPSNIFYYDLKLIPRGRMLISLNISVVTDYLTHIVLYSSDTTIYSSYSDTETQIISSSWDLRYLEINVPRFSLYKIVLRLSRESMTEYYIGPNYKYNIGGTIKSLDSVSDKDKLPSSFDFKNGLKNVSFLYNNFGVTNTRFSNKMYVKLNNYPTDREVKVTFIYTDSGINQKNDTIYSNYNPATDQFEFEFITPMNIRTGSVGYIITLDSLDKLNYYSFALPNQYQLNVKESKNIDLMGPIVTNIQKKNQDSLKVNEYGWLFDIFDNANGFKKGYVIIRGSLDLTERNVTISSKNLLTGTQLTGTYSVPLVVNSPCISQIYTIIYAYFEDNEGYFTEYDILQINQKNPFYKLLGLKYSSLLELSISCSPLVPGGGDSINPVLKDIKIDYLVFSNSVVSRTITVSYTAYHINGVSTSYMPTAYAVFPTYSVIPSYETIVTYSNESFTSFYSKILIPFNFDSLNTYYFSVYGIVSNAGTVAGYTPNDLKNAGFDIKLAPASAYSIGLFTSSSSLSSTGLGGVWIYGKKLNTATFQIKYSDENFKTIEPTYLSSTAVYFSKIKPTTKPIVIFGFNLIGTTDPITISPTVFNFIEPDVPSNTSSLCKGTPLCGGPTQGTCYLTGCKCILPWIGIDCMSKVITVPPPKINETDPSTNITVGEEISVTSVVSIVGVKELDFYSTEINKYFFDTWIYRLLSNDSISTVYTYTSTIKKDGVDVSNITATLEWFKESSNVQFANENVELNPSSIKYTIKITNYPFSSILNSLQLIMKASIQTDSGSCSGTVKQFGNLTRENSDYLKLQVDNYSFYGRFIKRCIVDDDQISTITNTILDNSMNQNLTNNHQNSQSYIGINIPYFSDNVVVDPDFSVLLDSNSASSSCKGSGLSKSQIAGIIIGSVCLFIVLVIIVLIIIYKSPGCCMPVKIFLYKIIKNSKS